MKVLPFARCAKPVGSKPASSVQQGWSQAGPWRVKDAALANVCAANLAGSKQEGRAARNRVHRKPAVIKASFTEAELA